MQWILHMICCTMARDGYLQFTQTTPDTDSGIWHTPIPQDALHSAKREALAAFGDDRV